MKKRLIVCLFILAGLASAQTNVLNIPNPILAKIGFDQKLGALAPIEVPLVDEDGKTVRLSAYLGRRPLLLGLVYFSCPHLCRLEVNGLIQALQTVSFNAGDEFEVALVSIDPKDTPATATYRRREWLRAYTRPAKEKGFHFLTGTSPAIQALAAGIGFRYSYDPLSGEYAHPSGVVVLTPEGRVSRYLYGIDFPPRDLRLALVEGSRGKIGTPVDRFLLYCYHYDPVAGRYGLVITRALRLAGLATVVLLLGGVALMLRREREEEGADPR